MKARSPYYTTHEEYLYLAPLAEGEIVFGAFRGRRAFAEPQALAPG
jgi:hypothetical protein